MQFKQNPFFNLLWENLTYEEGITWLSQIQKQHSHLLKKMDQFRAIDTVGFPRTYAYDKVGNFSPSTLRLVAIAGGVQQKIGDLNNLHVVQIGAGYGGLCKILHDLYSFKSYTVVDLQEQLDLAKKCLETLGVHNVSFFTPDALPKALECDLVISDKSFSEFNRVYQELFFDRVFSHAQSGYLLGRNFPKHYGIVAWTAEELKKRLKSRKLAEWEMQEPTLEKENYFICWKRGVKN